jgi:hypothetical protein
LLREANVELLLGSEEDLQFYRSGQLSPATALRIAGRYQWLAIGLVLGNVVTLLVAFVVTLMVLIGPGGSPALVAALLALAAVQLGVAVWIWLIGNRAKQLPVQRLRGALGMGRTADRLLLDGHEFRLVGPLRAAPQVGQVVNAYWVQPPLQRAPLAVALLAEDESR